jgi:uncharacterized small protein (DUF1192 family)
MDEDDIKKPKSDNEIGSNLDSLSVDELRDYINVLEKEIDRVKQIICTKSSALKTANDYFNNK